jgi:hypothetical protein
MARDTAKDLGPAAVLVTAFPSAVLILGAWTLWSSRLYPGVSPLISPDGEIVEPGPPSVAATSESLGPVGALAGVLAVLVTAVLLRPLQIAIVQFLEGYGRNRGNGTVQRLLTEWHLRRIRRWDVRRNTDTYRQSTVEFGATVRHARVVRTASRMRGRARQIISDYPTDPHHVMPTALGNVLRRAETTAGERYGLRTVVTYPRLYPYLSPRLDAEIGGQLNVIDTSSTFVVIFFGLSALSSPLLLRLDGWSLIPIVAALASALSYRSARLAARLYGTLINAAFDLHRFDMLHALHIALPPNSHIESTQNSAATAIFDANPSELFLVPDRIYTHPPDKHVRLDLATGQADPP